MVELVLMVKWCSHVTAHTILLASYVNLVSNGKLKEWEDVEYEIRILFVTVFIIVAMEIFYFCNKCLLVD